MIHKYYNIKLFFGSTVMTLKVRQFEEEHIADVTSVLVRTLPIGKVIRIRFVRDKSLQTVTTNC